MKKVFLFLINIFIVILCYSNRQYNNVNTFTTYNEYPVYTGNDLGVSFSAEKTIMKLWSPAVQEVQINIYDQDTGGKPIETHICYLTEAGVWTTELTGNYKNKYYTFQAKYNNKWSNEVPDPYAKAVGTNGQRGMIVDLQETNPPGWKNDHLPSHHQLTDIVLYELHIRDFSISPSSGIRNKGKYTAFTETGTENQNGIKTGIDHIAELGVTHVHLLPSFDFRSIDESLPNEPQYNWGYEPQHFNAPEGSYSSNPADGKIRIREYKKMVQALHNQKLGVIMDVVYNHTENINNSVFNQLVPGYYYRQWEDGTYGDASACGNELASEREMVRRYIIQSVKYWAEEYHVDGFRFDLMAIHDQETMNFVAEELKKINPKILIYGEGWTAQDSPLAEDKRALKKYAYQMPDIAVFSDDIRDGIKGSVHNGNAKGFVSGNQNLAAKVKFGIVAAGTHPQVNFDHLKPYTAEPTQVINYVSCHDNHTLYDKLKMTNPNADHDELTRLNALSNTIVLTSQGIPFLHAGVEMNRTKKGEENSYNLPDSINQIDWNLKTQNLDLFHFYKKLIALRHNHPAFRMPNNQMIQKQLHFFETPKNDLIMYKITGNANDDIWKEIIVIFNSSREARQIALPDGVWTVALQEMEINENGILYVNNTYTIPHQSAAILFRK